MIKLIKLVSGEEIVCEKVDTSSHRTGVMFITNPLKLTEDGKLVWWSKGIHSNNVTIPINYDSMIFELDANPDLVLAYSAARNTITPSSVTYLKG